MAKKKKKKNKNKNKNKNKRRNNKKKIMDEELRGDLGSKKSLTVEEVSMISSFNFSQLPSEIFVDILTRLSIESLVTLKTVSKWWNNTLENQKLAHQLISVSLKDGSQNGILTMSYEEDNSSTLKFSNGDERPKVIHRTPFESKDPNEFRLVNCCNGLICFAREFEGMDQIFICNPVTKEVITMPGTEKPEDSDYRVTYGLGFSPATGEYKVIGLMLDLFMKPKILTLGSSSSWRNIDSTPVNNFFGKSIYANGALHWKLDPMMCGRHFTDVTVMSFDIEKEEFYSTKDPVRGWAMYCRMDLFEVRGYLGAVDRSWKHVDIWVLKDNGKQWVKEYVLKVQPQLDSEPVRIIGLWQKGEIFIASKRDDCNTSYDPRNWRGYSFSSYDPKTDGRRDIHSIIEPGPSTIITKVVCGYTMSLVSLKPYGYKKQ